MTRHRRHEPYGIELRSHKVRDIMRQIPRSLTIGGWVVIAIIATALITALCLIEYPYSHGESIMEHLIDSAKAYHVF